MDGQNQPSQADLIRQWMEIATKYIRGSLPRDMTDSQAHDMRIMDAIVQAMPGVQARIDVSYRYHCNNCGKDFENLKEVYIGDLHKSDWAEVCPKCGNGTHVIVENVSTDALPSS
ncbi:MAG: zinc ribbon domain-containing protein [Candidatus Levybacteria bacterium]|nr:zinc ribbon domain-containing protein [Candidatus Levybacteria bacterium]